MARISIFSFPRRPDGQGRKAGKQEKTKDRYVSERRYGSFRRSLQIPGSVDAEKIEVNFKGGVLTRRSRPKR
jgi:HSP20 family molecular chaperone IbpA